MKNKQGSKSIRWAANYRRYSTFLLVMLILAIMIFGIGYKISRQSYFCPTCHYMKPYSNNWENSTHSHIECIKCHDIGFFKQTGFALKYLLGTYNPRPHSIIENKNCVRDGCHNIETLSTDREFYEVSKFNHKKHLQNILRGMQLNCVSCHQQIVQGTHITVEPETCVLCHFYRLPQTAPITGCPSCHTSPKNQISVGGIIFNHEPYARLQVPCAQCHTRIIQGNGGVNKDKCSFCHIERSEEYEDVTKIHDVHVTRLNNDCFACHDTMKHGKLEMSRVIQMNCKNCHQAKHTYTERMYMGTGAPEIAETPSTMFLSQVSCDGCHVNAESPRDSAQSGAHFKQGCLACHEKKYADLVNNWLTISAQLYTALDAIPAPKNESLELKEFVSKGKIVHNPFYAYKMLQKYVELSTASQSKSAPKKDVMSSPLSAYPKLMDVVDTTCSTFCHPAKDVKPATTAKG
ncbi:MAG: hypothetical protein A2Y62_00970, partial [Candidatus Fischerbacteria bacterium RBG_13_37_8]